MEEQKNKEKDAITKSDVLSDDKKLEIFKNTDLENKIQESLKALEPIYEMPQIQWKLSATLENLISVPMMQEIQKWADQLKNAFSVSTKIDFSNLSKALRNMTDGIEKSIHKIQIPSITEKRKQEILEKHKQWGCYGWTKNPYFEEILFVNITLDKKSADALALKQCSQEKMTLLFGNISEHKRVKKADFAEAVFDFENKKYKSCALVIFALIDSTLIRLQKKSSLKGKRRNVGAKAVTMVKQRTEEDVNIEIFSINLFYVNLFSCLEKMFENGNDFKQQPDIINRNFLDHGMLIRRVTRKDCIQLFMVYYNMLELLDLIYKVKV